MTEQKYDDTWLLDNAREIFEVIGWPEWDEHRECGAKGTEVVFYILQSNDIKQWGYVRHFCGTPASGGGERLPDHVAARFIRDYLREKGLALGLHIVPTDTFDGFFDIFDSVNQEMRGFEFNTYQEAVIGLGKEIVAAG